MKLMHALRHVFNFPSQDTEHLHTLLDTCTSGILEIINTGKIIYANKAAEQLFGYERGDLAGRRTEELLPEGTHQSLAETVREFMSSADSPATFVTDTFLAVTKSGEELYVSIELTPTKTSSHGNIIATITKSEKLKSTQDRLSALNERFEIAIESAQIGVWEYVLDEQLLLWDERMFKLYDADPATFTHRIEDWSSLVHPDDLKHAMSLFEHAITNKETVNSSFRIVTPSGKKRFIKGYGHVIADAEGKAERVVGVNYDLTEQYETQRRLRDSLEAL